MKWEMFIGALMLLITSRAFAAGSITYFSDGAIVELTANASKGVLDIPLAAGMVDNSLRVAPRGATTIQRVELLAVKKEIAREQELDALNERKNRLEDRLQALTTREDIFKAAAKSQSGKAPRKTKTNPDPMLAIRQGTDFAIAQLEAVNTARRKTSQELRRVEARLAELRPLRSGTERIARVHITPRNGAVVARYALGGTGWTPAYDLRYSGGEKLLLTLYGQLPVSFGGLQTRAAAGTLAEDNGRSLPATAGPFARVAQFSLPLHAPDFGGGLTSPFSARLTNTSGIDLPSGTASFYYNGEYRGKFRFKAISSGRGGEISSRDR